MQKSTAFPSRNIGRLLFCASAILFLLAGLFTAFHARAEEPRFGCAVIVNKSTVFVRAVDNATLFAVAEATLDRASGKVEVLVMEKGGGKTILDVCGADVSMIDVPHRDYVQLITALNHEVHGPR